VNRTKRVLVVDDDEDHLFLTMSALRRAGGSNVEVEGVHDGQEALDFVGRRGRFADRRRPHLLVLDLKMPKVDGFEVLHHMKSDPELRSIPIVVLSASDRPEDIEAAYQHGTNSYVTKQSAVGTVRDGMSTLSDFWVAMAELPEPPR
jgi:chemotaxis family two-component system response regulator Rcp1